MPMPTLTINGHDYASYISEMEIGLNDLDADGSGRDVQTGTMFRKIIGTKVKIDVKKTARLSESVVQQLIADLKPAFYQATFIDPSTNTTSTKMFYTSSVLFGVPRYVKDTGEIRYDGVSFSMTEK